jgi:hypothetical protein
MLAVERQAEVSAIRFSPTPLPDSGKLPLESEALHGIEFFYDRRERRCLIVKRSRRK